MRRIPWRDLEIAVHLAGDGPRQVLFVHGLGADHGCFHRAEERLPLDEHRLILPDLPGFGESRAPEGADLSMESLADALHAVAAALELTEVHLVAHSMGGAVALCFTDRAPPRVASFVCAEGNLVAEDALMSSKVSRLRPATFERVWSKWLTMVEDTIDPSAPEQAARFLESLSATPPWVIHQTSVSCWDLTHSGALAERFAALTCPRTYLVGERTLAARELPAPVRTTNVEVVPVPGVGHFLMENDEAFYGAVLRALRGA